MSKERESVQVTLRLTEREMKAFSLVEDRESLATFARALHYLLGQGLRLYVARNELQAQGHFVGVADGLLEYSRKQTD